MERIDYMKMCAECLNEEEGRRLFDRDRDSMLDGSAVWNQALEVAYNEYCDNEEEDEDAYYDSLDYSEARQNMPCDNSGYCGGWSCPRFHECQGLHH